MVVDGDRQQHGACPQGEGGRTGGQRGPFSEELDLDAGSPDVAVTGKADGTVLPQHRHGLGTGAGTQADDLHSQGVPQASVPLEQFGRLERLDHTADGHVVAQRQPVRRPLPATQVGHGHDHAVARLTGLGDQLVALLGEPVDHLVRRHGRQPEAVEVVVGVGGEDGVHTAPHLCATQVRRPGPAEGLLHDPPPVAVHVADDPPHGPGGHGARAGGHDPGQPRCEAEGGDYPRRLHGLHRVPTPREPTVGNRPVRSEPVRSATRVATNRGADGDPCDGRNGPADGDPRPAAREPADRTWPDARPSRSAGRR